MSLTIESMNPNIKELQYAVRGPIVQLALKIEAELKQGISKPFTEVVKCNIGDCHATGQQAITFLRQVVALVTYPALLKDPQFPDDAKQRAQRILDGCGGHSVGSYSVSVGLEVIRKDVAHYIQERDGIVSDPSSIFLCAGASEGIKSVLQLLSTTKPGVERAGVMVPIPQYPLYSATTVEYGICRINYYLDEEHSWGLNTVELERAIADAACQCQPRAVVVINPGNPTGQVLARTDIENVIRFAHKHRLLILADEVYQHNIYTDRQFFSFKRVLHEMGPEFEGVVQLASFMSTSKGFMGECGFRGGYCELINIDPEVQAHLYKGLSAKLCPTVIGQVMMDCVVNPPRLGEPSYESFQVEKSAVLGDLKEKARLVTATLNSMPGFRCNEVQGAMYAFPRIELPEKAIAEAMAAGEEPDFLYCRQLLEETGVCIVPGSGFGQSPGTYHFRITILPPVEKMRGVTEKIRMFHTKFMERYK